MKVKLFTDGLCADIHHEIKSQIFSHSVDNFFHLVNEIKLKFAIAHREMS